MIQYVEMFKESSVVQADDLHSETVVDLETGVGISYIIAGERIDSEQMKAALYEDYDRSTYGGRVTKWISIIERKGDRFPISMAAAFDRRSSE